MLVKDKVFCVVDIDTLEMVDNFVPYKMLAQYNLLCKESLNPELKGKLSILEVRFIQLKMSKYTKLPYWFKLHKI